MTIQQFNTSFDSCLFFCAKEYPNDLVRVKEGYNNMSDSYCKAGLLTTKQYNNMKLSKKQINKFYTLSKAAALLKSVNL
jgi:hypothetical protein